MISTGFEQKVKTQQIINNQLPEFILDESPKISEFLKQYYISQEYQSGPSDIVENLDQYLKFDNLTPEVISGKTVLTSSINSTNQTITVQSTKSFPSEYGLLKIHDEIITYSKIEGNTFVGCIRGFSAISSYRNSLSPEELVFSETLAASHSSGSQVINLSTLFLKEFYKKLKYLFAPGFEDLDLQSNLNVNNFLKQIRDFYNSKGTEESFKILFKVLYGFDPIVLNLEDYLIKPSESEYIKRRVLIGQLITPGTNPNNLIGEEIKSSDNNAFGPVSEVEVVTRNNNTFYKIYLFSGFDESSSIFGKFKITPKTKVSETVSVGASIITVDSTGGFEDSGSLKYNNKTISYTDKSVNQFFNCSGISQQINQGTEIYSTPTVYGYENGDETKKVEFIVISTLNGIENIERVNYFSDGDRVSLGNFGESISLSSNKTLKELNFNSWIYNVRSRYEIKNYSIGNPTFTLFDQPDKSSLKVNDYVDIVKQNSFEIVIENAIVRSINQNTVEIDQQIGGNNLVFGQNLSIIRRYDYASSSGVPLKYSKALSNVQNTYNDNNEFVYVASNSLPSYNITKNIYDIKKTLSTLNDNDNFFSNFNPQTVKYSELSFDNEVPFITGDIVTYTHTTPSPISGLTSNEEYVVEVLNTKNKIRLYVARSFVAKNDYLVFSKDLQLGTHSFTLSSHYGKSLAPKKSFIKIPLYPKNNYEDVFETEPGVVGSLISGVDIINYKSYDRIYYGPLESVKVINPGNDYDVLYPPPVVVSNPVGLGTTALVNLVVSGSLQKVIVDPNDVDIERVISVSLSGGNGTGAILTPIISNKYREVEFNAASTSDGGGLNISSETITFLYPHKFNINDKIVYNSNGNLPIGIGLFAGSNSDQSTYLSNGSIYYPQIINTKSIKLYSNLSDLNAGINTIGITTINNGGIHKFRVFDSKKVLSDIKVINSGSGYQNRVLRVKTSGISSITNFITFKNHGFNNGDLINYSSLGTPVSGISTLKNYYIINSEKDRFQLSDADFISVGASKTNYERGKIVNITDVGSGYQIFSYPPIKVDINVEYSGFIGTITASPILRGKIVDAYVYENGSNYGSEVLNFHKKPKLSILKGSGCQLKPAIINGKVVAVQVQSKGNFYSEGIQLNVIGDGIGCILRPVVVDGKVESIVVINGGTGYNKSNTSITIETPGANAFLDSSVRYLSVNNNFRFVDEILLESEDDLTYGVIGYSTDRAGVSFSDSASSHSKIIGWALDGNPIYGPYAYKDPSDFNSPVSLLDTSYILNSNNIYNRPPESSFSSGFFVEDYVYDNSGDLDENNGRFAKTPEFPNGTYAYYVGLSTDLTSGKLIPKFPYFIGKNYRSKIYDNSIIDQSFDLNKTSLIRNTFPYRVKSQYSSNDFLPKYSNRLKQTSIIETVLPGKVEKLNIINPGSEYSVGESLKFDNTETSGGGISAEISEIQGEGITSLNTTLEIYENSIIEWNNSTIKLNILPYHNLENGDTIQINGISTFVKNLSGTHQIKFDNFNSIIVKNIPSSGGIVTDISLSNIPKNISIGSSLKINQQIFSVLNKFDDINVLRVKRDVGIAHTSGNLVSFLPSLFEINVLSDYFESRNDDVVYFNPHNSIGVGIVTGSSKPLNYILDGTYKSISVPTQSIYLPNHPFKTSQKLLLRRPISASGIVVQNAASNDPSFTLLSSESEYVYTINKSKDYIGIVTNVGLTTSSDGLLFVNNGSFNFEYSLSSEVEKIVANVEKIKTTISTSKNHNLINGDSIKLSVIPSSSVGIGTSSSVRLKYNSSNNLLLVNSIGFSSSHVNVTKNEITLNSHGLYNGQKIFYNYTDQSISGLSTGIYYAVKLNKNTIKISETYSDANFSPPKTISIGSTGGSNQSIAQVNPFIENIKNNNLVFDVSDSSLQGFDFNIYYDNSLKTEFISIGNSSNFNVEKLKTIGVSPDASCKLIYNKDFPNRLYYSLSKLGKSVFENENENDFKIEFVDSLYNGEYKITGVGTTTFSISLKKTPEKLNYVNNNNVSAYYTTKSKNSKGPISNILLLNGGSGYKKLPSFIGISSLSTGKNAVVECESITIGKPGLIRILNDGFEYSSDNTIRPSCDIDTFALISASQIIASVSVISGGKNYISEPNLKLVNTVTGKEVNSGFIKATMGQNSISEIEIINQPSGLDAVTHKIFTVRNSNGIPIVGVTTYLNGIVECEIRTPPITGFSVAPFSAGDLIFVEGIEKASFTDELGNVSSPGTGFNSDDNGYNFFEVTEFVNSDPAVLKYNIGKYTNSAGVPLPKQTVFSSIVNVKNYPVFEINQKYARFIDNESISVNNIPTDIKIKESSDSSVKLFNVEDNISKNDIIKGSVSGSVAKISQFFTYSGRYSVDSSNESRSGWKTNVGKLNLDTQVIPDNDYYQNLSYSIKSPIEYDKFVGPVNSLIHPIGLKNFADVGITSAATISIGSSEKLLTTLNFVAEKRVDTINVFDFAADYDTTSNSSQFIRLKNKKLTDFIQCNTNRVLQIDDISNIFSSSEFNKDEFLELVEYPITDLYSKFLVQISTEDNLKFQTSEVVILNDLKQNTYTLNKTDLFTDELLGTFSGDVSSGGSPVLKFTPTDPYNSSYRLKTYRETFDDGFSNIGVGFTDYGFIRLSSKTERLAASVGVSTVVFRGLTSQFDVFYSNSLIINTDDYKLNYYEVIGYYDGIDTHLAEFYFDSENLLGGMSRGFIGTFGTNVDNNQVLNLSFTNKTNKNVVVKTKTVGFGTTASGIGTYRFSVEGQLEGTERTTRLESNFKKITGASTIKSFDGSIESSLKSIVKVSIGKTTAVHQVLVTTNQVVCNIQSYPFLSIGSTSGIGTFAATMNQFNVNVEFYPDPQFSSTQLTIQSYDQYFYTEYDEFNNPEPLTYGTSIESIEVGRYGSINNFGKDRLNFDLNNERTPIFAKLFNPKNVSIFNKETGIITIKNHFFETGEELIYTPRSSLIGVAATSVGIGTTIVGGSSIVADIISGFSTITGISTTLGISVNDIVIGSNIPNGTQITGIGQSFAYFTGNVVSTGSTVITGIANTQVISVGSGIFSGNNDSLGTVISVGINSIAVSSSLQIASNRIYYSNNLKPSLQISNVSTGTTFRSVFSTGISTDICPSRVYALKIDNDKFKITGVSGLSGIGFTFTSTGSGNIHQLEMKKKNEKTLITLNGVAQYPIAYTPLSFTLSGNNNGSVGVGTTFFALSGISSIVPKDILKIQEEFVSVSNVGFGTTVSGPITGIGTIPLVEVIRASLGSSEISYADGTSLRVYRGAYNIVGNQIFFAEAPDGKGNNARLGDNYLPIPRSTFNGRVFLRKDYSGNQIYDDISDSFTGVARTFTLYKEGNLVSNVVAGNNLVFINDIFQTPDTDNNIGNNYNILTSPSGISSVSFTGVKIPNTPTVFTVDYDVNQNQLPRGGLVVSVATTEGIGYAPLVGIPTGMIEVKTGAGGSITNVGFTTSLVIGKYASGTIGINSDQITGIDTSGLKINQRLTDIPGIYLPSITSRDIILPDKTKILKFNTRITAIGLGTVFISEFSTNSSSISTAFGFDIGPIFGSGYNRNISVGATEKSHTGTAAVITALVGVGGSIRGFNIISGGTGYSNPNVYLSDPSYQHLAIKPIFRPGIGNTDKLGVGLSISVDVGPSTKSVGIGSTLFGLTGFEIVKPGYGFLIGDTFTLAGLVTDSRLSNPVSEIKFTVTDIRTDSFSSIQLGEFDYIDSVKTLQNGTRKRFPLFKNNVLLSFEKNVNDPTSSLIDFDTVLLIYLNGVMQEPKVSYTFTGGTTFLFNEAPKPEDDIAIFFYRGTLGVDSAEVEVRETIKVGDSVQILKDDYASNSIGQDSRTVSFINSSDVMETGIYLDDGIVEDLFRPMSWTKQKTDLIINDSIESKQRDSIESMVFPTARIIKGFSETSSEIFVDDAQFFQYEENQSSEEIREFSGLIVLNDNPISAALTATVSSSSTISSINIISGGSGYIGIGNSLRLKTRSIVGNGGTDAIIDVSISPSGILTNPVYIINPGFGYTFSNPPQIIAPIPNPKTELINNIQFVQGFSGIVTGITTSVGVGTYLAIKFFIKYNSTDANDDLVSGYPVFISDTNVGNGITSIDANDNQVVGIGSTFLDNIYYIHSIQRSNLNGVMLCNVLSSTNTVGIDTTSNICGRFSWGRLSGFERSRSPIQIDLQKYTTISGLSTFPTVQRRKYGLRDSGALKKDLV